MYSNVISQRVYLPLHLTRPYTRTRSSHRHTNTISGSHTHTHTCVRVLSHHYVIVRNVETRERKTLDTKRMSTSPTPSRHVCVCVCARTMYIQYHHPERRLFARRPIIIPRTHARTYRLASHSGDHGAHTHT